MAQCQWQLNFHTTLKKDVSWKCRDVEAVSINRGRGIFNRRKRHQLPQCCSSSFPVSSTAARELDHQVGLKLEGKYGVECFVNDENYGWRVRRMIETEQEMRKVAAVQAEAFHQPLLFFDDLFFDFFQAEVLSGLLYRLKNSPPDRRQKVATALLKACDVLARFWGFEYLVLRAYEDDRGARQLYTNAGYKVVSGDAPWKTTWIGRRRRVVMVKQVSHESTNIH